MGRALGAILAGCGIWVVSQLAFVLISLFIWGDSPDSYFATAFRAWAGTCAAFAFALAVYDRIAPSLSARSYAIALSAAVLSWAASSMLSGVDVDYKLVSLFGHTIAAGTAIRMAGSW
jgi:hypothetical protein